MQDYTAIDRVSADLTKLLLRQAPLESLLTAVGNLAVASIPSCEEAGVIIEDKGTVLSRITTGETAKAVDAYQYQLDEGPCLHASKSKSTVLIEEMDTDSRWPRFSSFAHSHGVESSYSIPLMDDDSVVGVLNLYSINDSFGSPDETLGRLFAQEAAAAVRHAQTFAKTRELIDSLQQALESRSVIGAAVGIVMHRDQISMAAAFDKLVHASQKENIKLREVADRITSQYDTPTGRLIASRLTDVPGT